MSIESVEIKFTDNVSNLFGAFLKIQSEIKPVVKDSQGHKFTYASLTATIEAVQPVANKYDCFISQHCTNTPEHTDKIAIITMLAHKSGERMWSTLWFKLAAMERISEYQNGGMAISYMRRYALNAMMSLSQTDALDSIEHLEPASVPIKQAASYDSLMDTIRALKVPGKTIKEWLNEAGVEQLSQLSESQITEIMHTLEE